MPRILRSKMNARGASLVEYALLAATILMVTIVAIEFLGKKIDVTLEMAGDGLGGSSTAACTTGQGCSNDP